MAPHRSPMGSDILMVDKIVVYAKSDNNNAMQHS